MSLTSHAKPSNLFGGRAPSWLAMLALTLAVAAAYSNSLRGEFIFDDIKAIPGNPSIRALWPMGDVLLPDSNEHRTTLSRPALNLSLAINYALGGLEVTGYHLGNLLIHIAATLTFYGIVRRTLLLPGWSMGVR